MHAQHSYVGIWDDHEVEDNYAGSNPGEETQQVRGAVPEPQGQRRTARSTSTCRSSRCTASPRSGSDLYRRMRLGANVELFLLDERQDRDDQPCDDAFFTPCADAENEPRRFLGDRQKEWLKRRLRASGATWKLIGNQLMIMSLELAQGAQITKDSWDGYGVERREILDFVRAQDIRNVSFLTGDIHTFFAGDVGVNGRGPGSVATEFVGGSVTSLGMPETGAVHHRRCRSPREQTTLLTNNLLLTNPHIKYTAADLARLRRGRGQPRPDAGHLQGRERAGPERHGAHDRALPGGRRAHRASRSSSAVHARPTRRSPSPPRSARGCASGARGCAGT